MRLSNYYRRISHHLSQAEVHLVRARDLAKDIQACAIFCDADRAAFDVERIRSETTKRAKATAATEAKDGGGEVDAHCR